MKKLAEFLLIITGMGVLGLENTARASNNTGQPCGNHAVNSPAAHNTDNQDQEGDPFNPYTGNEYRSIPDLKVWGGVGEHQLSFTRFANSRFVGGAQYFGNGTLPMQLRMAVALKSKSSLRREVIRFSRKARPLRFGFHRLQLLKRSRKAAAIFIFSAKMAFVIIS
jgi:hypothetical protein